MKHFTALFLFFLPLFPALAADPFEGITSHELENGMKVILAPNQKIDLVKIRVNVGVGHYHEEKSNLGVSHLLEHVLFRNDKLKDDMSYLQLIQEKEGEANGTTAWDETSYFATIKKKHASWLMKTMYSILMEPSFSPKHIETEKKTVLLEIGEPSAVDKVLGFNWTELFSPKYLKRPSYWEKEFGVQLDREFSRTDTQLSTIRMNRQQVIDHYQKYYDPSNMRLLVSGGFEPKAMLRQIEGLFGKVKGKGIGDQRPNYAPKIKEGPFYSTNVSVRTPTITLGHQVQGVSYKDGEVLGSYFDYLAHRLMKSLRNQSGETYTVRNRSQLIRGGFGYYAIGFSTSKEKFGKNFDLIKEMLHKELVEGKLSAEDIKEAKRLYLNSFVLWGESEKSMGHLADKMLRANEAEGSWLSPFQVLNSVSDEEYISILKKHSIPHRKFQQLDRPELFFENDQFVLLGLSCIIFFFLFRRFLTRPFQNEKVRWVRKVRYPPLRLMELAVSIAAYYLFIHAYYFIDVYFLENPLFLATGLIQKYSEHVVSAFMLIASFQAVISFIPRKLYLMDDKLVIKGLSYFSRHVPKDQIKAVSHRKIWQLKPREYVRLWKSFFYFDPLPWRAGLLVELQDGRIYFFSAKAAPKVAQELKELLQKEEHQAQELSAA